MFVKIVISVSDLCGFVRWYIWGTIFFCYCLFRCAGEVFCLTYSNMDNVPTQTAGTSELLASDWNTFVRDNFDAIKFGHVVVADATARTNLGNVAEGVMVYQSDNNKLYVNSNGTTANWVEVADLDNTGAVSDDAADYLDQYAVSSRNVIINGAMQVAQRATSVASLNGSFGYYTADRWNLNLGGESWSITNSVASEAPTGSGFSKSLKITANTGDNALSGFTTAFFKQIIEGQNLQHFAKGTASAKTFAFQCWVRASITGSFVVELRDVNNSRHIAKLFTINAANTWEKKTFVFPADTTGTLANDNTGAFEVCIWFGAGGNYTSGTLPATWASQVTGNRAVGCTNFLATNGNTFQFTGIQLEAGDVNTPFEFEPYETTLSKCQRYYYRIKGTSSNTFFANGFNTATNNATFLIHFPQEMREVPTDVETTLSSTDYLITYLTTTINPTTSPTFQNATKNTVKVQVSRTGLTAGQGCMLGLDPVTPGYFAVSAEL